MKKYYRYDINEAVIIEINEDEHYAEIRMYHKNGQVIKKRVTITYGLDMLKQGDYIEMNI